MSTSPQMAFPALLACFLLVAGGPVALADSGTEPSDVTLEHSRLQVSKKMPPTLESIRMNRLDLRPLNRGPGTRTLCRFR